MGYRISPLPLGQGVQKRLFPVIFLTLKPALTSLYPRNYQKLCHRNHNAKEILKGESNNEHKNHNQKMSLLSLKNKVIDGGSKARFLRGQDGRLRKKRDRDESKANGAKNKARHWKPQFKRRPEKISRSCSLSSAFPCRRSRLSSSPQSPWGLQRSSRFGKSLLSSNRHQLSC